MTNKEIEKVSEIIEKHRKEAVITCAEDCWCWELEKALTLLEKAQKERFLKKIDIRLKHFEYILTLHLTEEEKLIIENRIDELEELKKSLNEEGNYGQDASRKLQTENITAEKGKLNATNRVPDTSFLGGVTFDEPQGCGDEYAIDPPINKGKVICGKSEISYYENNPLDRFNPIKINEIFICPKCKKKKEVKE